MGYSPQGRIIASVIADTPLYLILTSFAVLVFLSIGVANLFILHGIVIDKMSVKEAVTVQKELTERSDLQRIVDCIMTLVS